MLSTLAQQEPQQEQESRLVLNHYLLNNFYPLYHLIHYNFNLYKIMGAISWVIRLSLFCVINKLSHIQQ